MPPACAAHTAGGQAMSNHSGYARSAGSSSQLAIASGIATPAELDGPLPPKKE
jgi:hypothetical protein